MTKTVSINDVSIHTVVALVQNGDDIVIEENGNPVAKVTLIDQKLEDEFLSWEAANDEDLLKVEKEI
ncbi:MAG TPA: hypothetical protein VGO50_12715 [Pyrinomonadaceae bacterium]|jgi:antitoxin (DNA-binding transcriptional repressor) of toxin-antitoxin stability system|nr:hypothetical protein [Pyrinomonadaceae bacterium]